MKKFIAKLYGAEVFADAECIKGRKSSGVEDSSGYDHWADRGDSVPWE